MVTLGIDNQLPSNTLCGAKFNSSRRIQVFGDFKAANSGPSRHLNDPNCTSFVLFSKIELSTGRSVPKRSAISVCSQRLILTRLYPMHDDIFSIKDDFPTP